MHLRGSSGEPTTQAFAWRAGVEWGLRLVVLVLLAGYLLYVVRAQRSTTAEGATSADLSQRLARWSTVVAPARVHVRLAYPPPVVQREWLGALAGAGTVVSWSGTALVPTAAAVEPLADPVPGVDLAVAAPAGATVVLRDALGSFDSVTTGRHGVRVYLPTPPAMIEAAVGPVVAQAARRDSLTLRRLLLLGHASWEAKYVHAALEERGWQVDAFVAFSPKGEGHVRQGTLGAIDTATYAAVLALDTVAARYAEQIRRYVYSGGGLLLWAPAAQTPGLAALAVGASGAVLPDDRQVPGDSAPRAALALAPLTQLRPEAVVVERQKGQPALAARRIGLGRVLQIGYVDAWRWRLAGRDDDAPAAHREWLARLVASVAYTSRHPLPVVAAPADVAPLATLVDRLGPAVAPEEFPPGAAKLGAWLFALLVLALLLEWTSRRLRGVP